MEQAVPCRIHAARMHGNDLAAASQIYTSGRSVRKNVGYGDALDVIGYLNGSVEMVCDGTSVDGRRKARGKDQQASGDEILTNGHGL